MNTSIPYLKALVRHILERYPRRVTLLAVCPNSEAVTRAALLAAHEAQTPLLFAATLNQIDIDGGYTGWTPGTFTRFVREQMARLRMDIPVVFGLDHGGPWLKDRHVLEGYTYEQALEATRQSLEACLDAGYTHFHLDGTGQPFWKEKEPLPVDTIIERTTGLMEVVETLRKARDYPPVSYEVGTEEVGGGLDDIPRFEAFLKALDDRLKARGWEALWPCFVVGPVGTDLYSTHFDPELARRLTELVMPYGALLKGHYTDYVENPEDYPLSGMGGANVGPELADVEYQALMELVHLARKVGHTSGLPRAIRDAVLADGRWRKWVKEDVERFDDLPEEQQQWLLRTASRYIWRHPVVEAARQELYRVIAPYRDAEAFVLWRIKQAIQAYYHRFNSWRFLKRFYAGSPLRLVP